MVSTSSPSDFLRLQVRDPVSGMVPKTWLTLVAEHLDRQGIPPAALMPRSAWDGDGQHLGRYPAEAYCQLLLRVAHRLNDPLLGFHLGQSIQPAHLGAMGYVLQSCESLGAALLRVQRYHRLLHDINPIQHHVDHECLVLQWGTAYGRPGALFDEAGITAIVQFARGLCGQRIPMHSVEFVNPRPRHTQPFVEYFGCDIRWGQPVTRLVIGQKSLRLPLQRPDPLLLGLMEAQVEAAFAELPDSDDVVELTGRAVRQLTQLARLGIPTLEQVAAELGLSSRVLYRQLAARGHQYRQIRDQALKSLAETYLADPRLSLGEVGGLLGYTEQSAFTRTFRRWTGRSPSEWRRQDQRPS